MTAFRRVLRLGGILALLVFSGPLARSAEDLGPPLRPMAFTIGADPRRLNVLRDLTASNHAESLSTELALNGSAVPVGNTR